MALDPAATAAALRAALVRHTGADGEVQALQRLTGGATKQTWAFDWNCGGRSERLVLQQMATTAPAPGGPPKLSAAEDAAVMVLARQHGVPAPVLRLVLNADGPLGPGTITEHVDGQTLGRKVVADTALAPARAVLARQCGAALAAIHRLPAERLPFLQTLSPADELRLYGALLAGLERKHAALAYALRWVANHLPTHWTDAVVHADFRTGNLIVGPEGLRCVLDWEIARIGDPMQDLGVLCLRTWRFGGTGPVGGFGTREDLYAAYEDAGGGRVDPARVHFWEVFSNLKWAISCVRRGSAQRADGRPAGIELSSIGRRMEEPLWDLLGLTTGAAA